MIGPETTMRLKAADAMAGLVLRVDVRGLRRLRFRIRTGTLLLRLAALVIGLQLDLGFSADQRRQRASSVEPGLPRRIAAGDFDPRDHGLLVVELDGMLQSNVVGYDADRGTVTRARVDEGGRVLLQDHEILFETLGGAVAVRRATPA